MTKHITPIALITGASRGLGRSAALKLAESGVDVLVTYKGNQAEAHAVVDQIRAMGRKSAPLQLDVGNSTTFAAFATSVKTVLAEMWQRECFDYLINNAGVGAYASIAQTTEEQFELMFNVHLKGPFFLTQELLALIADDGRIVNVSSGLTRFSTPGYAAYAAMKGGLEVLTRYMAQELGARGIAVNTLAPGAVETDFGGGLVRDNAQVNAAIASHTALGRVGLPDDLGGAMASLLASGNRWVNAQRIEVSGGVAL